MEAQIAINILQHVSTLVLQLSLPVMAVPILILFDYSGGLLDKRPFIQTYRGSN